MAILPPIAVKERMIKMSDILLIVGLIAVGFIIIGIRALKHIKKNDKSKMNELKNDE